MPTRRLSDSAIAGLRDAFKLFAPPKRENPSEWMEREYVIAAEGESAEPGRYSFARYEMLRGVFDWTVDPEVEVVALAKAAQIGFTTGFTGLVASLVENDPSRILVAMPTQDEGKIWSKDRFDPQVAATPILRGKIKPAKSRDGNNTLLHKRFPGGTLKVVGANSSTGLSSWPAKYAFADEVDRYPLSAGGEGDPIALIRKRLQTWLKRGGKLVLGSTPKVEQTSIIWHYYMMGDQQRFHVPCPHKECGEAHPLEWENLRWEHGKPETAAYVCPACGSVWSDMERLTGIQRGFWRATCNNPVDPKVRSAWIDGLLSPHVTHVELATAWLACESNDQRQAFVNLYLGRPWKIVGEAPDHKRVFERRERWPANRLPAGVLLLTAGVDVQKDRLEARVWGWGRGKQSWLIDTRVIMGSPTLPATWSGLTELLEATYTHASGAELPISRMAVDSGYSSHEVYAWVRQHGARTMAIKGDSRGAALLGIPAGVELRGLKRRKSGVRVWPVNPDKAKEPFYDWLRLDSPETGEDYPPGYVHIPDFVGEDEIRQLTAEELVVERTRLGFARTVWRLKSGRRNEALDCRCYAHAAAIQLGLDRFGEAAWSRFEATIWPEGAPKDGADSESDATPAAVVVAATRKQRQDAPETPANPTPVVSQGWTSTNRPRGSWLRRGR